MANKKIMLVIPEELLTPSLCENGDDFVLFLVAFSMAIDNGAFLGDGTGVCGAGLRFLLSEYMACIAAGYIRPFADNFEDKETTEIFRNLIIQLKERAVNSDVPTKEVDGKIRIDVDKMYENDDTISPENYTVLR